LSTFPQIYAELARYNCWQNGAIYDACERLGAAALGQSMPMLFFGTLEASLDHILHVDLTLLDVVATGQPPQDFQPAMRRHRDFATLQVHRRRLDAEIQTLIESQDDAWFTEIFDFHSERLGRRRRMPRAFWLTQMFNHQAHHRGQITAALHALGVDYGPTDLPANPLSQF
jgi:uncharacterized damage-inducible protein DinB